MNIYLTIVVVLCAIGASVAVKNQLLVPTELNHDKSVPRETKLECKFDLEDGESAPTVTIEKKGTNGYTTFYKHAKDADAETFEVPNEILKTDIAAGDKTKNEATIKAAKVLLGDYKCGVTVIKGSAPQTSVYSPDIHLKAERETIEFKVETEGANDKKQEFGHDAKLDATLDYVMADDKSVLVKAEFRKEDLVFFRYTADGEHLDPVDDAKDKGVNKGQVTDAKHDKPNHKLTLVIKDAVKETEGKYNVKFYYKDTTDAKDTLDFVSKDVTLTYTGGAATTMISFASISTLLVALVAMRSNL